MLDWKQGAFWGPVKHWRRRREEEELAGALVRPTYTLEKDDYRFFRAFFLYLPWFIYTMCIGAGQLAARGPK